MCFSLHNIHNLSRRAELSSCGVRDGELGPLAFLKNISLTKTNTAEGPHSTHFQEPQVRAGAGGGEGAGGTHPSASYRPARAPSGYVMVSLRRVPAPIRVLHRCSTSVAAQLFSGGLLSGDGPQGTTTTQNPRTRSTPTLWFSQTLIG